MLSDFSRSSSSPGKGVQRRFVYIIHTPNCSLSTNRPWLYYWLKLSIPVYVRQFFTTPWRGCPASRYIWGRHFLYGFYLDAQFVSSHCHLKQKKRTIGTQGEILISTFFWHMLNAERENITCQDLILSFQFPDVSCPPYPGTTSFRPWSESTDVRRQAITVHTRVVDPRPQAFQERPDLDAIRSDSPDTLLPVPP